jgi:hypothetical protein
VSTHGSNTIIKFADDITVVGLITGDDESAYREEVNDLAVWCRSNNLSLNISKAKGLIVDYREQGTASSHPQRRGDSGAGSQL